VAAHPQFAPPPPDQVPPSYSWMNISTGASPNGRFAAATTFDTADGYVLLFGGENPQGPVVYGDTWLFVRGNWRELCSGSTSFPACPEEPTPSILGAMTYDAALGAVLYYDWGSGATWSFLHGSWTNRSALVHPPLQIVASALGYDSVDGVAVLLTSTGATWTYNATGWHHTATVGPGPAPRVAAQMFFDIARDRLVLFGGLEGDQLLNDTWSYFNGTWSPAANGTAPLGAFGADYDQSYGYGALLVGTASGTSFTQWGYVNSTWRTVNRNGSLQPPATLEPAFVYDPVDGYLVVFSGEYATPNGMYAQPNTFAMIDAFRPGSLILSRDPVVVGDKVTLVPLALGGVLPYTYTYIQLVGGCSNLNSPTDTCTTYQPGQFTLVVSISDGAWGHTSPDEQTNLIVVPVPVPTFVALPDPATAGLPVQFTSSIAGGLGPFHFAWRFGDGTAASGANVTHIYSTGGSFIASLVISNASGVAENTTGLVIVNPAPSITILTAEPNVTDVGLPVAFSAVLSGGTPPDSYLWRFGAGQGEGAGPQLDYAFSAAGSYEVHLWANDSLGAASFGETTVTVNPDPTVRILANPAPYNTSVQFAADLSGGTGPYVFIWSFGDGTLVAGAGATHPYAAPGRYLVTVTVRDAAGFGVVDALNLTVNPGTPPAPPPPWYEVPTNLIVLAAVFAAVGGAFAYARRAGVWNPPPPAPAGPVGSPYDEPELYAPDGSGLEPET
jgi:PKD repeat protein